MVVSGVWRPTGEGRGPFKMEELKAPSSVVGGGRFVLLLQAFLIPKSSNVKALLPPCLHAMFRTPAPTLYPLTPTPRALNPVPRSQPTMTGNGPRKAVDSRRLLSNG